ncbi:MAG: DUF1549 domain-containing protein [Isosphaeraceae bacterium]
MGTGNRSIERRGATSIALGVVMALGVVGIVTDGPAGRAFAFQSPEGRKSKLGPGSTPTGEMPKPAPSSEAGDDSRNAEAAPKSGPQPSLAANADKKPKLTQQEARELTQALRQLQAAVNSRQEKVAVNVQRPTRSVTPPTLTSAELDRLVDRYLAKNDPKVDIAPITTDVEFVRRVYFDLIGKPPTPEQFTAFVRDHTRDKRARLIDSLLNNKEWARNWARYWRDVIRFHSTSDNPNRVRFDALEDWLADQFQANKPWDEIAARMITATGRNDESGAVAFPLAYEAQPVEMAGEVSRIFMGVQIQCAQCHDHKTDSWKRQQFHEFAAFFAGARPRQVVQGGQGQLPVFAVVTQPRARYTMPDKDNPTRQIPIAPRFFLSSSGSKHAEPSLPESLGPEQRRELVASYITGQDNTWFARAFINRIWYALMGESFYDPIDDIGPERTPRAPEILEPLATQWQRGGYDVRWLYRTLMNTQAYQRRARSTATSAGKTPFASGCPSRMRADQVFEALVQALGLPLDAEGNLVPQALMNRPRAQAQAKNATVSLGDTKPKAAANKKAVQAAGLPMPAAKNAAAMVRRGGPRLAFERLFGVDPSVANDDVLGTIPQALFLMNSPLVNSRTTARPGTVLGEILASAPNEPAALNALYLRVLSRHPTPKEAEICGRYLAAIGDRREAFEDIYWSLINSTEFVTRR